MSSEPSDQELIALRKESDAIQRGDVAPGRVTRIVRNRDGSYTRESLDPEEHRVQRARAWEAKTEAARIRHQLDLTQAAFAKLLGVALPTVQKWEQGREPKGAAKKLLQIAREKPQTLLELADA